MSGKLVIFNHPLIHHKLALIRDENTGTKDFRQTVSEIGMLMAYEVTRDLPTKKVKVKTPVADAEAYVLE
ncbi:MAG: uracil phosphoribosyltransferase, partial [Bacilli bacterium]